MTDQPEGLRLSVSVSRKANLGNYQSADLFLSISNIEVGATKADLEEALITGELAFGVIKGAIDAKIADLLGQKAAIQQRTSTPSGQERPTPSGYTPRNR